VLGARMAAITPELLVRRIDVVTWAPTSVGRRRRRGFDQAELLAREVAALLGLPVARLLVHRPDYGSQTGATRSTREARAAEGLFRPASGFQMDCRVLLVDDVITTGATLRSAASTLRVLGATEVHAVVAAARL
jgi:competence protein ComFC